MKPRIRKLITGALIAVTFLVFFGGVFLFPDAPITLQKDGTYRGKQNQAHTREEFERCRFWESSLKVVFPACMLGIALMNREDVIKSAVERTRQMERERALKALARSSRR